MDTLFLTFGHWLLVEIGISKDQKARVLEDAGSVLAADAPPPNGSLLPLQDLAFFGIVVRITCCIVVFEVSRYLLEENIY